MLELKHCNELLREGEGFYWLPPKWTTQHVDVGRFVTCGYWRKVVGRDVVFLCYECSVRNGLKW